MDGYYDLDTLTTSLQWESTTTTLQALTALGWWDPVSQTTTCLGRLYARYSPETGWRWHAKYTVYAIARLYCCGPQKEKLYRFLDRDAVNV